MESLYPYDSPIMLSVLQLQERIVTCGFDVAYEKALHAAEKTLRDEEARQLRLQLLLAQAEAIDVRYQLNLSTAKNDTLEKGKLRAQYELEMALRNCEKADSDLRSSLRKNEALEVCVVSIYYSRLTLILVGRNQVVKQLS
jgi:hypothetical protein